MAKEIECWICGKKHEYCPTCEKMGGWRRVADTPKCYQIYITLKDYEAEVISKGEAAVQLKREDVFSSADLSWMLPSVEKAIRNIVGEKEKDSTKTTKKSKLFKD